MPLAGALYGGDEADEFGTDELVEFRGRPADLQMMAREVRAAAVPGDVWSLCAADAIEGASWRELELRGACDASIECVGRGRGHYKRRIGLPG
jgi:hypothetical protein